MKTERKTERGKITSILDKKQGNGADYRRVNFEMENGKWAKTDLVPGYKNYPFWLKDKEGRVLLRVGTTLGNLQRLDAKTINADSRPFFISFEPYVPKPLPVKPVNPQLSFL